LLEQIVYPTGETETRTYDAAGNLTRQQYSGGLDLQFTYDDLNRITSAAGITLTYNEVGQVVNTQNLSASFGATYDNSGRLETVSYADGLVTVTYQYDERGLLTRVSDSLTGATVQLTYDDDRRLTGVQRSNGVNTTLTWNTVSRLARIQEGSIADEQYTYNAAGEMVRAALDLPLDPADYLVDQVVNLSYDDASQVSSFGYTYDARGRLTSSPGHTYTWDGASRLVGVDDVTLGYNGLGNLVTRTVGSTTTHYYYNYALGLTPIVAESVGSSYKRFYVYTPDGSLLYLIDPATNQAYFYHFDSVGSTLFLTDGGGSVTDAYVYDPYGNLLGHTGSSDQPFTYIGQHGVRWEPAGGIYHMRARYYDPATARFLTRDPVWPALDDPQSLNPYQYANRNPLRFVDVTGEQARPGYLVDGEVVIPDDPRESVNKITDGLTERDEEGMGFPGTLLVDLPTIPRLPEGEKRGVVGESLRVIKVPTAVTILRGERTLVEKSVRYGTGQTLRRVIPKVSTETGGTLIRHGIKVGKVAKAAGPAGIAVDGMLSAHEIGTWIGEGILHGKDAAISKTQENSLTADMVGWLGEKKYAGAPVRGVGQVVSWILGD